MGKKILFTYLVILSCIFSIHSFAEDTANCRRDLCIGDVVYDTDSNYGKFQITGFDGEYYLMVNEGGKENREGYSYLAKENFACDTPGMCLGDTVIDTDSLYIFAKIIARKNGTSGRESSFVYSYARSIASEVYSYLAITTPTACTPAGFCVGDEVTDKDGGPGGAKSGVIVGIPPPGVEKSVVIRYSNNQLGTEGNSYLIITRKSQDVLDAKELDYYEKEGVADRALYNNYRRAGMNHKAALDAASGPGWFSYADSSKFLRKLSQYVYQGDSQYLFSLADMASSLAEKDLDTSKTMLALLLPWLKNSGYRGLQQRYIDPSLVRMQQQLENDKLLPIQQTESTISKRKLALAMLANSLIAMKVSLSNSERQEAEAIIAELGRALSLSTFRYREWQQLMPLLDRVERLYQSALYNLYLTGRISTDMAILEFLRNS